MLIHQHFGKLPLDPDRCGILAYRIGSDDDLLYIFEGWRLKHGSHQEIIQDGTQSASAGFLLDRHNKRAFRTDPGCPCCYYRNEVF